MICRHPKRLGNLRHWLSLQDVFQARIESFFAGREMLREKGEGKFDRHELMPLAGRARAREPRLALQIEAGREWCQFQLCGARLHHAVTGEIQAKLDAVRMKTPRP